MSVLTIMFRPACRRLRFTPVSPAARVRFCSICKTNPEIPGAGVCYDCNPK